MTRTGLALSICIGMIALGVYGFARPQQVSQPGVGPSLAQQTETPAQVVQYFLGLSHGLYRLSPADKELLKRVTENPTPYIAAVKAIYAGVNIAAINDREEQLRFQRAVALLAFIGTNEALSQIADWYKTLDRPNTALTATQRNKALHLKRVILSSLETAKQDEIITSILGSLENMDYATRIAALEYVSRAGANDPRIINALQRLLNDRNSTLYQDKALKRSIETLSKPR